jgi:hypothetical protein
MANLFAREIWLRQLTFAITGERLKGESPMSEANEVDGVVMCNTPTIPTSKKYREVQYSTVKKRSGRESTPFLGLESGTHKVKFYNEKKEALLTVKTWLSPYGWAWKIVGT